MVVNSRGIETRARRVARYLRYEEHGKLTLQSVRQAAARVSEKRRRVQSCFRRPANTETTATPIGPADPFALGVYLRAVHVRWGTVRTTV